MADGSNKIDSKKIVAEYGDTSEETAILTREIDILSNNINDINVDNDNFNKLREKLFDQTVNLSQEIVSLTRDIAGLTVRIKQLNESKTNTEMQN